MADPYASVPDISQPGTTSQQTGTTFTPGYWGVKIKIGSPGTYTFLPGIYYLDAGPRFEGSATIIADNVLFYVNGGMLDMGSGPTDLRMSGLSAAQDPGNLYLGLSIFQARSNTKAFVFGDNVHAGARSGDICSVTAATGIAGGIYLPSAPLNVRGNGSTLCTTLAIVANTIKVEETSTLSGTAFVNGGTPKTVIALID